MPALEQVTLSGLSAEGSGELTLERAFADDPALATVTLPASNWEGNDLYEPVCDPRQISSMRYMFEGTHPLRPSTSPASIRQAPLWGPPMRRT